MSKKCGRDARTTREPDSGADTDSDADSGTIPKPQAPGCRFVLPAHPGSKNRAWRPGEIRDMKIGRGKPELPATAKF